MRDDDFSIQTKETLGKRVGMRCSNPTCRKPTSGPREEPGKAVNIGVASHITAAAPSGPRYNDGLTSEQRCSIDNAIWLCQNCAKLVDNDDRRYTVDILREWKDLAEERARLELERRHSIDQPAAFAPTALNISGLSISGPGPVSINGPDAIRIVQNINPLPMVPQPPTEGSPRDSGHDDDVAGRFRKACCKCLDDHIKRVSAGLNDRLGNKDYYVEPVLLDNQRPVCLRADSDEILLSDRRRFVLLAQSGYGKTIFLQQYFIRNATSFIAGTQDVLPFCFHLQELRATHADNIAEFLVEIVFGYGEEFDGISRGTVLSMLDEKLRGGEILFLLDGFDQTRMDDRLMRFLLQGVGTDAFRASIVVIASRPYAIQDYKDTIFNGYAQLEIAPFNPRQIRAYFAHLRGEERASLKPLMEEFFELIQTPMLMALLGKVANSPELRGQSSKADIYAIFCRKILGDNQQKLEYKFDRPVPDVVTMMSQLQEVAYIGLNEGDVLRLSHKTVTGAIMGTVCGLPDVEALRMLCQFGILYSILDQTDMRDNPPQLEFKHQSFQAYFAARHLLFGLPGTELASLLEHTDTGEAWLEALCFFAEMQDAKDDDKLRIARTLLSFFSADRSRADMLYRAAKVYSCTCVVKDADLGTRLSEELQKMVEVNSSTVLQTEDPFKALRDIGEIAYLTSYARDQEGRSAVNRFYAFKYALSGTDRTAIAHELQMNEVPADATMKLDIIFGLFRLRDTWARNNLVEYFVDIFEKVSPRVIGLLRRVVGDPAKFMAEQTVGPIWESSREVPFFYQGNPLYDFRKRLNLVTRTALGAFERKLLRHVYKHPRSKWSKDEDVCMIVLGTLANDTLVARFYDDFLDKESNDVDVLYKQAVAAVALTDTYPGDKCKDQEMVRKVTARCIKAFENGRQNPFRYYLAYALAKIGNAMVGDYFLEFLRRPNEDQRWFASMVLGCLNVPEVTAELERLAMCHGTSAEERSIRHFAGRALLVYNQTY